MKPVPLPARVYLATGEEVTITQYCLGCRRLRPLVKFGLRRIPDPRAADEVVRAQATDVSDQAAPEDTKP